MNTFRNYPGDIEPEVMENIQKRSVNTALDEKPTMDEMVRAIKGLKDGKAPGGDGIPAEPWKYGGANLSNRLHRWIIKVWEEGHVPQAWKDTNIVTIYKKDRFQRSRPTCGGTVKQQTTPANRDYYYPDSLPFVSAGFLPRVRSQRLN